MREVAAAEVGLGLRGESFASEPVALDRCAGVRLAATGADAKGERVHATVHVVATDAHL
jgi:hypothetical protein